MQETNIDSVFALAAWKIIPGPRRRLLFAMTLAEGKTFPMGTASGSSIREIAKGLQRATSLTICIDCRVVRSRFCYPTKTSPSSHNPIDIRSCLTSLQSSGTMLSPSHRVQLCYPAS
jgi:hypothetical protein